MSAIASIHARQILDSRGNPTVEVEVALESGARGLAAVPSGRLDRRVRGGRAARRRRRLGRQGRLAGGRQRQRRDRRGADRRPRRRAGRARPDDDRARRDPEQGPARRQRAARRLPGGGEGGGDGLRAAALPLPGRALRRRRADAAAGADDERAQRRRPRRQLGRLPGVHGRPGRGLELLGVPADRDRGLPRAEEVARLQGPLDRRSATRAASRPNLDSNEAALEAVLAGVEAAGYEPGSDVFIALDPATSEIFEGGAYVLEHEGQHALAGGDGRLLGRTPATATRSSRSRTAWTRRTGTAGRR